MLAASLYRLHKNFRYMISNNTLKADQPKINFYYEDIITYIKKYPSILNNPKNSKIIYQNILQKKYQHYNKIGQSIWNQHAPHIPWNLIRKNTFYSYTWPENNNIIYTLLHYAARTNDHIYIDRRIKNI